MSRYGDFSIFQDGGRRHLGFFKFHTFNGRTAQEGRSASPCQIWSKSVKTRLRYGDISIFQHGGRRHLGFFKFQIFNGRTAEAGRTASLCQISSKSVKTRPRHGDFSLFYKMAAGAILDFSNFKILTVGRLKRAELRRRAKFGRSPSNRGRNMAIFRFCQDGGYRHLGFFKFQIFNGRTAQKC